MNNNEDKSANVMILVVIGTIILGVMLYFAKDFIAIFQSKLIKLDFFILKHISILQYIFGGQDIMQYYQYVNSSRFDEVGFEALDQTYYNVSTNGEKVLVLEQLYNHFFYLNSILISILFLPFFLFIKKIFSKEVIKFKINLKKEEVYPGIIKALRRKDSNGIFEIMDYIPPFIQDLEEFKNGSLRISMKARDNIWIETQEQKILKIKEDMKTDNPKGWQYDYLKLMYIYRSTGNSKYFKDDDLVDYLKWLRYKDLKPIKNRRLKLQELPKELIHNKNKSNKDEIVKMLKLYLQPHYPDKEFGLIIMPKYYIFNPLTDAKLDQFKTKGSQGIIKILKKYMLDDFEEESQKNIAKLKKENKSLEKKGDEISSKQIEENLNLILDIEALLDPHVAESRKKKIIDLTMTHKFEETLILALLEYGRKLVNLPVGVLSPMKFDNSVLWYALTSIGRTYQFNAGLPLTILYKIEKNKALKKEEEKLDPVVVEFDNMISDETFDRINETIGNQFNSRQFKKKHKKE